MIGAPTDGVETLHDRDIIPINFEVSGRDLKAWHRALATPTDTKPAGEGEGA
ncbi:hypothetical protein [Sphingomonas sp. DC1100-1]|uniref:hypothetical protein n=1 Tax=unclassified Sphingomonas TaxID=196159 RepID=UPI003CF4AA63